MRQRGVLVFICLCFAALAFTSSAAAAPVRIFAVGNKQRVADAVSYQTYRDKMAALMDAGFPNRSAFVQNGVDDVASHVRPADPDAPTTAMAVFPEDVGLVASMIGSRGAAARQQTTAVGAIGSLAGTYAPQFGYYAAKYPGQPPIRTLVLALTDTLYRSFYETFRGLAIEHGVYITASANIAPARRIEQSDDPALVAALRDPDEPARTYAYEAVSPNARNSAFVFTPSGEVLVPDGQGGAKLSPSQTDGAIQPSLSKAYLTPIETPPPAEGASLQLAYGPVRDMEVIPTAAGRLGIVISKDAWMVDVNDRFAAKGANVILQPEAFSAWAYEPHPWQPDIFKEGGFGNLQKIPGFLVNVNSSMTGNFADVTFDGQSALLQRKRKADPGSLSDRNAWIGQNPDTGFAAIAPWIEPDPGIADPGLTLAQRRAQLAADGAKLLPGSGVPCSDSLAVGACENGYREAVVWGDVVLPDGPVTAAVDTEREKPVRFDRSVQVSDDDSEPAAQNAPAVAADGKHVYVAWHETRSGTSTVWLAVSRKRGRHFSDPIRVSANPAGSVVELNPTVAADRHQVVVAWQEFTDGRSDDRGRIKLARFSTDGRKQGGDVRVDDNDLDGKWLPQVAFSDGVPVVAWIDERDRGPEGEPLEHVYAARANSGSSFGPAVRVDGGTPVALAAHIDNKWSPTITASRGRVYVAWADFRNYNWDVFMSESTDGGLTFGPNMQINDGVCDQVVTEQCERIDERPSLAVDKWGAVHAAWTDLTEREPDTNIFYAVREAGATAFSANKQLDDSKAGFRPDVDTPTSQWHPSLVASHHRLFAAWQDNRLGNNDIFFTSSENGGVSFRPSERVDDTDDGVSEQTSPQLALANGRCYVAWEDNRNGTSDIYAARRKCPER
jgi:hypothetical protein